MPANRRIAGKGRRGFVIGELLIGLLLLALAVSSLAALMYSVSRRSGVSRADVACVSSGNSQRGKCVSQSGASGASKLLRSGCAMRAGMLTGGCDDEVTDADSSETIVRSRTDSASLELLARKQKALQALRDSGRPDRGFSR